MTQTAAEYLQNLFGLDGKTAVVIGGTGTLGGAFCDALAGAGAHVLVAGADVGGTNIMVGVVDDDHEVLDRRKRRTPDGATAVVDAIVSTGASIVDMDILALPDGGHHEEPPLFRLFLSMASAAAHYDSDDADE